VSSSNPPPHPDLIFVAPAPGRLDVVACREAGGGLQVVWHEQRPLFEQATLPARLADILARHALPTRTRSILIVPPGTGGLLSRPALDVACRDTAWQQRQIEMAVPYPLAEIRYSVQCAQGMARIFWLPSGWLDTQKAQLGKLGLDLMEAYPRAACFEGGRLSPGFDGVLYERSEQGELIYDLRDGRVRQTASLPAGLDAESRQACLAGLRADNGNAGVSQTPPQESPVGAPAWADVLPALWRETATAIPADAGGRTLWSPFFRLAMLVGVALTVLAGGLSWAIAAKEAALTQMSREKKKLGPQSLHFQELDRSLRGQGAVVAAVGQMNDAPTPLSLLARFTQALPKKAWMQQMVFDGKSLLVSGKGIGDDELIGLLREAKLEAEKTRPEPVPETDDFRLRVREPAAATEETAKAAAFGTSDAPTAPVSAAAGMPPPGALPPPAGSNPPPGVKPPFGMRPPPGGAS
jgi:hypothetical protein